MYPAEWESSTATGRFFAFGATVFPEKAHLGLARRFVAVRYTIFSLRISFFVSGFPEFQHIHKNRILFLIYPCNSEKNRVY